MKKILVPTDFSLPAKNAARYALPMATLLHKDIVLCNAMTVPTEPVFSGTVVWPLEDYSSIKEETTKQLDTDARKLNDKLNEQAAYFRNEFKPKIHITSDLGPVPKMIKDIFEKENGSLVVMGVSGTGGLERFIMGSSSRATIENADFPVLLIPKEFRFRPIQKIAFATDLDKSDINVLHSLTSFAKAFEAEIEVRHIADEKFEHAENKHKADAFMAELGSKVTYPKITYNRIKSMDVNHGLDWLQEHSLVDMMAMVHRPHNLLTKLLMGSHTAHVARHITLPLLVFPPAYNENI